MSWYMESKFLFLRVGWGGEWSISYYFTTKIPFEVVFFFFIFLFFSLTKAWHFNKRLPNCEWKQNFKHFLNSIFFFLSKANWHLIWKILIKTEQQYFFPLIIKEIFIIFPPTNYFPNIFTLEKIVKSQDSK